jgi:phosphatidate phosphatase LPIN
MVRSDVLGNILPAMGRDWSHAGVACLYNSIQSNGYNMLYLTSRAIGQSSITRNYLTSLQQDEMFLPRGPIIMSPDRLMTSFKREIVLRQPEVLLRSFFTSPRFSKLLP